ncbi:hypothetical protein CYMTET_49710 [Cymbomonas tetramitiformis]|uniref:Uncharacterized protein n=1 Tax=Cymbomonas tetramitiformis TaxID=36881 RepID=A0AAE0BQV3_9CHLO|nr:hypothetical protein CYMTET_49710 [Cymbomonas tetramitiformis]
MDLVELIMEQRRLHSAAKKAVLSRPVVQENGMYIDRATKSVARSPKTCALLGFALLGSYLALHQLETLSEKVSLASKTAGSGDSDSDKQQIPPEEMQEEPAATASELTQAVSGTGDVQSRLPLTFALFFIGDATGRNGQWLGAVLQNIRKHHPNRQRFPIVILTDERTKFGALPGTIGVELRRQAHAKQEGVPDAYRYLYRAMAERSVLQEALDQGRPTHAIFLDATDIIVRRSLVPLFKEQAGHEFGLALTYRPPRGKASGNSLAATQPVNLGVKAVHGWALQKGVRISHHIYRDLQAKLYRSKQNLRPG